MITLLQLGEAKLVRPVYDVNYKGSTWGRAFTPNKRTCRTVMAGITV